MRIIETVKILMVMIITLPIVSASWAVEANPLSSSVVEAVLTGASKPSIKRQLSGFDVMIYEFDGALVPACSGIR